MPTVREMSRFYINRRILLQDHDIHMFFYGRFHFLYYRVSRVSLSSVFVSRAVKGFKLKLIILFISKFIFQLHKTRLNLLLRSSKHVGKTRILMFILYNINYVEFHLILINLLKYNPMRLHWKDLIEYNN